MLMSYGLCFQVPPGMLFSPLGAQQLGFAHASLHSIPMAGICASWSWSGAHTRNASSGCTLNCFDLGGLCYSISCPLAIPAVWWGIQLGQLDSHPISPPSQNPPTFPSSMGGFFFSRFVPTYVMANSTSVVGMKPSDSSMVIGYQVDEFALTWLAECFFTQSHIILASLARCHHLSTSL